MWLRIAHVAQQPAACLAVAAAVEVSVSTLCDFARRRRRRCRRYRRPKVVASKGRADF